MTPPAGAPLFLVLDQGTSSSKVFLFDDGGRIVFRQRVSHRPKRPAPYHVESDPRALVRACRVLLERAVEYAREQGGLIHSAGLAVQRSTFLFWERDSLKPLTPAISWQDSRAHAVAAELEDRGEWIHSRTGIPLSAHFGGPKFLHLTRAKPELLTRAQAGEAYFGPLSSYLTHCLTGRAVVDDTIAGRTLLVNLATGRWDRELGSLFQVPRTCLPTLVPVLSGFGSLTSQGSRFPLRCVIGDQQAALLGQGGWEAGALALNLGTSGSLQLNAGNRPVPARELLSSYLYSTSRERRYMVEGTINACNSLFHWLEGELDIPHQEMRWERRCARTATQGVLVPGFAGLSAPYWRTGVETVQSGFEKPPSKDEIIRAGMESIGFLAHDIFSRMKVYLPATPEVIVASGGGARPALLQFLADLLQVRVGHTAMKDRTALGVYYLLQLARGAEVGAGPLHCNRFFSPRMEAARRQQKLAAWYRGLAAAGVQVGIP